MKTITKLLLTGLTALALTACGSSGGGDSAQDKAIDKISNYAQNGGTAPTLQDYLDAGVTGITNVDEINAYVSGLTKEDVDTKEEIQAITSELEVEITANIPPIAKGGSPKTTVEIGETVKFSSRHSSDPDGEIVKYQWFENGVSIAKVPFCWKVYNVAGTYNIKLVVTDNDGATSSDEYTVTVNAPVVVAATPVYDIYFENNTTTYIPPNTTTYIDVDADNAVPSITKITVTIDMDNEFDGDLVIKLKSPSGTTVLLSNQNGGGGDNYTNTTFDDDAATSITAGSPPFTGTFKPEEPLANFVGEDPNGIWTLSIQDVIFFADDGDLYSWSITVQ